MWYAKQGVARSSRAGRILQFIRQPNSAAFFLLFNCLEHFSPSAKPPLFLLVLEHRSMMLLSQNGVQTGNGTVQRIFHKELGFRHIFNNR